MQTVASTNEPALRLEGVRKSFGSCTVIPSLNLSVGNGEVLALLGPNGAGKSTTIAMALGFLAPDKGSVFVGGHNVLAARAQARAAVAYIPENVQLYPLLSGLENLQYFAALAGLEPSDTVLEAALTEAGISKEAQSQRVSQYSKGMRQKVGIAIALMRRCRLLLLDEPTSGLDPTATDDFYDRLQALAAGGVGVLLTTHDIAGARECAHRVVLMRAGELVAEYNREEFEQHNLEELYRVFVRGHA